MASQETKKRVPLRKGVFQPPASDKENGYLIGSRCQKCGHYFYRKRAVCINCHSEDIEEVALSTRGTIWTYTIARQSYPGTLLVPPFVIAIVELPEQVQLMTAVTDCDPEAVRIGMEVELYFWKVTEDEEGNEVMAFAFRPVYN